MRLKNPPSFISTTKLSPLPLRRVCPCWPPTTSRSRPVVAPPQARSIVLNSEPAANGFTTVLNAQEAAGVTYFDAAGAPGRTLGLKP